MIESEFDSVTNALFIQINTRKVKFYVKRVSVIALIAYKIDIEVVVRLSLSEA